ncbi:MAG: glycosyltransferase [Ignavibacteriales bacterium]|nr:glycosyltransferase [Ignavibacteriales bacterium]
MKQRKKIGFNIQHVRRSNREGFKAGALKEGLKIANGEFVAIFDADFIPQSDFLKKTFKVLYR